jgi:hypothetical protein
MIDLETLMYGGPRTEYTTALDTLISLGAGVVGVKVVGGRVVGTVVGARVVGGSVGATVVGAEVVGIVVGANVVGGRVVGATVDNGFQIRECLDTMESLYYCYRNGNKLELDYLC